MGLPIQDSHGKTLYQLHMPYDEVVLYGEAMLLTYPRLKARQ
ncbi:hypothetical protein [Paraglaciecola arctica]|uniref:Uncharacterized protein n=1 Tax=Paraglaciecola arctica BSs20135 TaxID=493475 RepID=K6YP34_9ALTE|nr:hypothetical protein [Paraglaciecola arctica]GAC18383.1 hypothetical protein GARC_1408 [Paraglaciecola arctica BSs20135]